MTKKNKIPIISTKTGDNGETSLWSGERVEKNHPAIKCVCELDIFDSAIGLNYHLPEELVEILKNIQSRLVYLKGELATHPRAWKEYGEKKEALSTKDVEEIDSVCENYKEKLQKSGYNINGWVKYGEEGDFSARLDYLRSLCRKCEIEIYELESKLTNALVSKYIKQYVNRLSDLLYILARYSSIFEKK